MYALIVRGFCYLIEAHKRTSISGGAKNHLVGLTGLFYKDQPRLPPDGAFRNLVTSGLELDCGRIS